MIRAPLQPKLPAQTRRRPWPSALAMLSGLLLAGCTAASGTFTSLKDDIPSDGISPDPGFTAVEPSRKADPALLQPSTTAFTLGPGDKLEIELMGDPTSHGEIEVGPDGKIYFYILPGLDVWGLTLAQTEELIAQQMEKYQRTRPAVTITLRDVESKRIWILGRLNTPGVYSAASPTTLLEAISMAGGVAPPSTLASLVGALGGASPQEEPVDLQRSFVIRKGKLLPVDFQGLLHQGDLSQNIYLQPDDFVYMPPTTEKQVYIMGAVAQPRAVGYTGQLSLVQTVASAGGPVKDAYISHVAIVRGPLSHPKIGVFNYYDIAQGRAVDVVLKPDDIVYVPFTPYRTLTRYVDLILDTFVRTVGVNEGARAASGSAPPVAIGVQAVP
jgi:polysaccharide export outer membrane protein